MLTPCSKSDYSQVNKKYSKLLTMYISCQKLSNNIESLPKNVGRMPEPVTLHQAKDIRKTFC